MTFLCSPLEPGSERNQSKLDWMRFCRSATIHGIDKAEQKAAEKSNPMVATEIPHIPIIWGSSHRDGTTYKGRSGWQKYYDFDVADAQRVSNTNPFPIFIDFIYL